MSYHPNNARIHETQAQVDDIVTVMRSNVDKVLERDVKLSDLDRRADDLDHAAIAFATTSKKVKNKMWWENLKMKLIIGGCILAFIIILALVLGLTLGGDDDSNTSDSVVVGKSGTSNEAVGGQV